MTLEIPEVDLKLEEKVCCPECFYSGRVEVVVGKTPTGRDKKRELTCPKCLGVGYLILPTNFGEEILDFIKKHLFPAKGGEQ